MGSDETNERRGKRPPKPLDETKLRDLALSYAARYATTAAKLESYLIRKIRERGFEEDAEGARDTPALVEAIVERLVELRYVDDEVYAKTRAGGMLRRGYGGRRVDEALRHAGVDQATREDVAPDVSSARDAAATMANKRRFGPFDRDRDKDNGSAESTGLDPAKRQKQIAAMLRAGHNFDIARFIIDARSTSEVEEWLSEANAEAASLREHNE